MLRLQRVAFLCAFLPALISASAEQYNFGMIKRTVLLRRSLAPEVQLTNASIGVAFAPGTSGLNQAQFSSQLITYITQSAQGIRLDPAKPDYEIRITVLNYVAPHEEETGIGANKTKTLVGHATVNFALIHRADGTPLVTGSESYHVTDLGNSFLADPSKALRGVFGKKENTLDAYTLELLQHLALQVASHMAVEQEEIAVYLGHGPTLDDADKLGSAGRWNEYLEKLSTMQPIASPADDAYRLYDIGVANEALGYTANTPKLTLQYLQEASVNYTKAMGARSTEKYFVQSQDRIEQAIKRYASLEAHEKQMAGIKSAEAKRTADREAHKKTGELNNADIIDMVAAKVDPSIITTAIRTAPVVKFDTGVDGLISLSSSGVPTPIIQEMTARAAAAAAPTKAVAPPAAQASPAQPARTRKRQP